MYSMDSYYKKERLNYGWGKSVIGSLFGFLLIFVGLVAISMTVFDLMRGISYLIILDPKLLWISIGILIPDIYYCLRLKYYYFQGKGIWVGSILVSTGIVGLLSAREQTQISLYVFNAFTWLSVVFSFVLLAVSILDVQTYVSAWQKQRFTQEFKTGFVITIIFITSGALGFWLSVSAAVLSCLSGGCCCRPQRFNLMKYEDMQDRVKGRKKKVASNK